MRREIVVLTTLIAMPMVGSGAPARAAVAADAACKDAKAKAAGKKAESLLQALGKNGRMPDPIKLAQSVSKAQSKLTKAFSKSEAKGGCLTTGDATTIEAKVDAFVADMARALSDTDVTVANLNLLHGLFCTQANCRLEDRVDLFYQWVAGSGCPDAVTLQEVADLPPAPLMTPLIEAQSATACAFPYEVVVAQGTPFDDSVLLTRYPVLASEVRYLHGLLPSFRHVLFARIDHPVGPVDIFTTHLASGSDGASNPCEPPCPTECVTAGATTNRECQAVQMALFIEEKHDIDGPAVVTGDFNAEPGTFEYDQFADRGWLDTYLAVGNPECVAATGVGCTSGRDSSTPAEIESTDANVAERIDYTFLVPATGTSPCVGAALDPAADEDGDGAATRIFADAPNPFAPACGPIPDPVCWPSDHEGTEIDLNCGE
jgi:endonuclease/exonuclease/phosphatase family metal-dependent hydrolase